MIRRIQALNYRCLRYVDVALDRYHLLVGPNASGKSTLCDAIAFLSELVRDGLEAAVANRSANLADLVWGRPQQDGSFELAVEFDIPDDLRALMPPETDFETFRYQVAVGDDGDGPCIRSERGILRPKKGPRPFRPARSLPGSSGEHPGRRGQAGVAHRARQIG